MMPFFPSFNIVLINQCLGDKRKSNNQRIYRILERHWNINNTDNTTSLTDSDHATLTDLST